jgi:hypothetical protein
MKTHLIIILLSLALTTSGTYALVKNDVNFKQLIENTQTIDGQVLASFGVRKPPHASINTPSQTPQTIASLGVRKPPHAIA